MATSYVDAFDHTIIYYALKTLPFCDLQLDAQLSFNFVSTAYPELLQRLSSSTSA